MQQEPKQFADRQTLMAHVKNLSPSLADRSDAAASPIIGGRKAGEAALAQIDPIAYGDSRNFLDGAVTRLSPYIRHGILSLNEVRNHALDRGDGKAIEKFIQELGWRDFWQRIYAQNPDWLWRDIEDYKTGFAASDYADELPDDIANGETDSAAMNHFIAELKTTAICTIMRACIWPPISSIGGVLNGRRVPLSFLRICSMAIRRRIIYLSMGGQHICQ